MIQPSRAEGTTRTDETIVTGDGGKLRVVDVVPDEEEDSAIRRAA